MANRKYYFEAQYQYSDAGGLISFFYQTFAGSSMDTKKPEKDEHA